MSFLTKMANILDNDGDIDRLVVKCGYNRDLKSIQRKYGEVFLVDDKLYCMVSQKNVDNILKRKGKHQFILDGFCNEDKLSELGLPKDICYVFDGIIFNGEVSLVNLYNSETIFKNCVFNRPIELNGACVVSFINNTYYDKYGYYEDRPYSFLYGNCYHLKFINENFVNSHIDVNPSRFSICVYSNNIDIINSNIKLDTSVKLYGNDVKNDGGIYLESKKIVMNNSNILASDIFLNCEDVQVDGKNKVSGSNRVTLINDDKKLIRTLGTASNSDELEIKTLNFIHNDALIFEEFSKKYGEKTFKFTNAKVNDYENDDKRAGKAKLKVLKK